MVLSTWHLILILGIFVCGTLGIIHFVGQAKNKKTQELAKELQFTFVDIDNIPAEFTPISSQLRYFWGYEFLMVGQMSGTQVFFTQYLEKMASQLPYVYALGAFFEKPLVFINDEQKLTLQKQVDLTAPGAIVTEHGIFYYHPIPWNVQKQTLEPIFLQLVQAVHMIQR